MFNFFNKTVGAERGLLEIGTALSAVLALSAWVTRAESEGDTLERRALVQQVRIQERIDEYRRLIRRHTND